MWEQPRLLCDRDKDFIHSPRTNTTTLCPPLPSSFPLCSFLLAFVALTSPPPPSLSLLPSLFCPASHSLLMWTKWKGNRLVQGCDLALLTPTHSTALRGSQQSESHAMKPEWGPVSPLQSTEGREKNPCSTASSCNHGLLETKRGSDWQNWVSSHTSRWPVS